MGEQGTLFGGGPSEEEREANELAIIKAEATTRQVPKKKNGGRKTLYLVDGPNMAFRAHYSIRGLTNSKGMATGALFGYCAMIFKLIEDFQPDYLAMIWDPPGGTFRNDLYPDYKATRSPMPDELRAQMPFFPKIAEALGIAHIVGDNVEADDVMGTLAVRHKEQLDVTLVTGDKDMMQLVDTDRVTILDTMKDRRIGPKDVIEKWAVPPERIIDILAIMGDSSDNIPGVRGIGKKGAADLIQRYGGWQQIFDHRDEVKGRAKKPLAAEGAYESAKISYELATIKLDCEIAEDIEELALVFPPKERAEVKELFQQLEFHRFLDKLGGEMKTVDAGLSRCVVRNWDLKVLVKELRAAELISVDTETTSLDPNLAELVGLSFCTTPERAWYVPIGHTGPGADRQLDRHKVIAALKPILEDTSKRFIGQHIKYDQLVLRRAGIELAAPAGDTMIADYLLNPSRRSHKLDGLALTWLGHKMISYEDATRDSDGQFAGVDLDLATTYAAEDAHVVYLLHEQMTVALDEAELSPLYRDLELPLIPVLGRMEQRGVLLDVDMLRSYSEELGVQIAAAEAQSWEHAGRQFNSASPKQLAQILFEELGLKVIKKTKTGPSTDASVLERLASEHPLPGAILRYRMLSKLKSTYVDALPPLVNPETGRIHTHYHQAVAATGRLSSANPNLQNIPIRTSEGRRVREAFIPAPGYRFLSADYSQVELRVLAHLCGGEGGFARAFRAGEDVHSVTASEVFNLPLDQVTSDMRRTAKAINFGIVYGQTDYGLSQTLGITRKEAAAYIERYKAQYPEVDQYVQRTVDSAKQLGSVSTILGRRRRITDLTSSNFNQREQAKRLAINTPVQGSAADIIKLAMLQVDAALRADFPEARMLMQVHDELVLEVPEQQLDAVRERVVREMESAFELKVDLKVDVGSGANWEQAH